METWLAVLGAVVLTALVTSWAWRQAQPSLPPPPPPPPTGPDLDALEERLTALTLAVAQVVPALEARLAAIERKPLFDPSPIVGRLAAIEGGLADLKKARPASADLGPLLAAIESLRPPPPAAPVVAENGNLLPGPVHGPPDDLGKIKGIGPKLVALLGRIGVFYYWQIAEWTPEDVGRVDALLEGFRGRIERDGWIAQCQSLPGPRP